MMRFWIALLVLGSGCEVPGGSPVKDPPAVGTDADGDGWTAEDGDCDDLDPDANPGLTEVCDGSDNDCDGGVDVGLTTVTWADIDGDGYGDPATEADTCGVDEGRVTTSDDCDDGDPDMFPGNPEVCDGDDNDCNDQIDEGVDELYYADVDGDGFGSTDGTITDCYPPDGYTTDATDCDDAEAARFPDNPEVCDGLDNDCDEQVDDGVLPTWYADLDADGYGDPATATPACEAPAGYIADDRDCDDADLAVHPDGAERCDGVDNDCDGYLDTDATDQPTWYADADADSFGDATVSDQACEAPAGYVADASDCDDGDGAVFPGAAEVCNTLDDDCDGGVDVGAIDALQWYTDADADGVGDADAGRSCEMPTDGVVVSGDCDDADPTAFPGGTEVCLGGDEDCDRTVDEDDASDAPTWYADADGDAFGDASTAATACLAPAGRVADATDCDDTEAAIHPTAEERCDGVDNNCDGIVDEPSAVDAPTWYADADGDAFGDVVSGVLSCTAPAGYVADATDCDDTSAAAYPGGTEVCDGHDNQCDGEVDESTAIDAPIWYPDADRDGYGRTADATADCDQPAGYVAEGEDCDDVDAGTFPSASEVCDDADNDCDGQIDNGAIDELTWYRDADRDGYGFPTSSTDSCDQPSGYVASGTDCNDGSATTYPGAAERCDTVDQDCDGELRDDESSDATARYLDGDGDGYGDADDVAMSCDPVSGRVDDARDCDDGDALTFPMSHATELPGDGVDTDCDGVDACRDLNCDAWPDIVFTNYDPYTQASLYVYYGGPSGYSTSNRDDLLARGSHETLVEDLDGDGYLDVLLVGSENNGTYESETFLFYGTSAGPVESGLTLLEADGVEGACIADFDQDGTKDIALAMYRSGTSSSVSYDVSSRVFWGSYSWTTSTDLASPGATSCATGDLDSDGYPDLVLGSERSSLGVGREPAVVYHGSASGLDATIDFETELGSITDVWVGDMDGDGRDDLLATVAYDGDTTTDSLLYLQSDRGAIGAYTALATVNMQAALVADLDANGENDVAFVGEGPTAYVYHQSGAAFATADRDSLTVSSAVSVAAGDLDRDGDLDLVYANAQSSGGLDSTSSYVYWRIAGGYTTSTRSSLPTVGAAGVAVGDLDGDGYPEVVFSNQRLGTATAIDSYVYWGSSAGYSTTDRTSLPTEYAWGDPVLVGAW